MPESVLTILKFCFLALLYLFLFRVVRVVVARDARARAGAPQPARGRRRRAGGRRPAPSAQGRGPARLRILEPADRDAARAFALGDELTVGRGGGCGIVLADDTFVSQVHARVFRRDGDGLRRGPRLAQRHAAERRTARARRRSCGAATRCSSVRPWPRPCGDMAVT